MVEPIWPSPDLRNNTGLHANALLSLRLKQSYSLAEGEYEEQLINDNSYKYHRQNYQTDTLRQCLDITNISKIQKAHQKVHKIATPTLHRKLQFTYACECTTEENDRGLTIILFTCGCDSEWSLSGCLTSFLEQRVAHLSSSGDLYPLGGFQVLAH